MQAIEIFKPGRWTAMGGETLGFAAEDLSATASAYDPEKHEAPIVVGHPKDDGPAYGWVRSLAFEGGSLQAETHQIDPAFAELVEAGRFKKVSAAFYKPDAPGNPAPGVYYLRHVGVLGAQPPAVKGLRNVAFADEADGIVVFGDFNDRNVAGLFRRLREYLIEKFGQEDADKALPGFMVDFAQEEAARPPREDNDPAFAAAGFSEATQDEESAMDKDKAAAEAAAEAEKRAQEQAAFTESRKKHADSVAAFRRQQAEHRVDGLISQGKLPPGHKAGLVAFMASLPEDETIEFSETEGDDPKKVAPRQFFEAFLDALPKQIEFAEVSADGEGNNAAQSTGFAALAGYTVDQAGLELHRKAVAFQEKHDGVDYVAAVQAVSN